MKLLTIKRINLVVYAIRRPLGNIHLWNLILPTFMFINLYFIVLNIINNSPIKWNLIAYFIFCAPFLLVICLTLVNHRIETKYPQIQYSRYGTLYRWYDRNYKLNVKYDWLNLVIKNLEQLGIFLSRKLVIVSPSGNKGKYEKDIAKRFGNFSVIVTDYLVPDEHETSNNNYTYLGKSNNALNIKSYLSDININEVDIIWDIKGALWYSGAPKADKDFFYNILKAYHTVLKFGGSVIIDAYTYNSHPITTYMKMAFRSGYVEKSTYSILEKKLQSQDIFAVTVFGEGASRIAQLKKKTVLTKEGYGNDQDGFS